MSSKKETVAVPKTAAPAAERLPVLSQSFEFVRGKGFVAGTMDMCGRRQASEDVAFVAVNDDSFSIACLADGHGGRRVAERIEKKLSKFILQFLQTKQQQHLQEYQQKQQQSAASSSSSSASSFLLQHSSAASEGGFEGGRAPLPLFLLMPAHVSEALEAFDQQVLGNDAASVSCGATLALLVMQRRAPNEWRVVSSAVGDSTLTWLKAPRKRQYSNEPMDIALNVEGEHAPNHPREFLRISQANGQVLPARNKQGNIGCYRIDGDLNVSHALGDFRHKMDPVRMRCDQRVVVDADSRLIYTVEPGDAILLTCDGFREQMTRPQMSLLVRRGMAQWPNHPELVVGYVAQESIARGSGDNHSAILVVFTDEKKTGDAAGGSSQPFDCDTEMLTQEAERGAEPPSDPPFSGDDVEMTDERTGARKDLYLQLSLSSSSSDSKDSKDSKVDQSSSSYGSRPRVKTWDAMTSMKTPSLNDPDRRRYFVPGPIDAKWQDATQRKTFMDAFEAHAKHSRVINKEAVVGLGMLGYAFLAEADAFVSEFEATAITTKAYLQYVDKFNVARKPVKSRPGNAKKQDKKKDAKSSPDDDAPEKKELRKKSLALSSSSSSRSSSSSSSSSFASLNQRSPAILGSLSSSSFSSSSSVPRKRKAETTLVNEVAKK